MTWREGWAAEIQKVHETLPEDATLEDRIRAIKHLAPSKWDPSWAKKSWQAARRDYLVRYGYVPKTKKVQQARAADMPLFDQ